MRQGDSTYLVGKYTVHAMGGRWGQLAQDRGGLPKISSNCSRTFPEKATREHPVQPQPAFLDIPGQCAGAVKKIIIISKTASYALQLTNLDAWWARSPLAARGPQIFRELGVYACMRASLLSHFRNGAPFLGDWLVRQVGWSVDRPPRTNAGYDSALPKA